VCTLMSNVLIPHLGTSTPPYLVDCVEQIRLWNKDTNIFILLDPCHKGSAFWTDLQTRCFVIYVYTDTLEPTLAHKAFSSAYVCDTKFRKGYWRYVVERFFYVEEVMRDLGLTDCCMIEYDVLIYTSFTELTQKLKASHQTCRLVCDNSTRCYPSFIYVPTAEAMGKITTFIQEHVGSGLNDMELLGKFAKERPEDLHYLPVITEQRNRSVRPRKSATGHVEMEPWYLSENAEDLGVLFDSLVVGQGLGGIDPRNIGGRKSGPYANETALYSMAEMPFEWKHIGGLWQPYLDSRPLAMIHLHCKALKSYRSDRPDMPKDDYTVNEILGGLVTN